MAPDLARAARIARFPVELVAADVTDLNSVIDATAGCDVVIHCAYGSRGDPAERLAVNWKAPATSLRRLSGWVRGGSST